VGLFARNTPQGELSFVDHLEALRWHIMRIIIVMFISGIVCFIFIDEIFDVVILAPTRASFPPYRWLCALGNLWHIPALCLSDVAISFQNTQLSGQFMMSITASITFGFIAAFPYIIYEIWRFIKPALTPKELSISRSSIFWISLLFFAGVLFGYYIITPYTVNFFANYKISPEFENIIKIDDYLSTLMSLVIGAGLIFELPVVVYFLSKVGLLTPNLMRTSRKYALVIVLVLSAIITPPDVFSQILVAIPIMFLYEISIKLSARVEKRKLEEERREIEKYKA
jgi:sec-independent protein translocase protein TatC